MENSKISQEIIPWEKTASGEQYFRGVVQTTKVELIKSFNKNGQLPTDPLLLWDNGEKFVIIEGNHCAQVWKDL